MTIRPRPLPSPVSSGLPVPGYHGCWCVSKKRTEPSLQKIAWVPLPWCTSQSAMSTRSAPNARAAWRAPIARLLKTQKPMPRACDA